MAAELDLDDVAAMSPKAMVELVQLRAYADALNERCIADAPDAERYRWIKSRRGLTLKTDGAKWTRPDGSRFVATHYLAEGGKQHAPADSLDAVIDAATIEAPRVGAA